MSLLFKNKDEAKQGLRICSIVMIFMAMVSAVLAAVAVCSGELRDQAYTSVSATEGVTEDILDGLVDATIVGTVIAMALVFALEWFVASRGLKESRGEKQKKGYITLMKVYLVFGVLSVIAVAMDAINRGSVTDWMAVVSPVINVLIAFYFVEAAQTVRGNK